jgi:hypothetical protein
MIAVVGGFIALAFGFGIFALSRPPSGSLPMLAGITPTQTGRAVAEGSS